MTLPSSQTGDSLVAPTDSSSVVRTGRIVLTAGHIVPEAQAGGPIALVKDGDRITISADRRVIDLEVSEEEMEWRRQTWKEPPLKVNRGTLYKYAKYAHPV
jgi:dihydroxyacid dehydratase/phosphogluconate dehydratase